MSEETGRQRKKTQRSRRLRVPLDEVPRQSAASLVEPEVPIEEDEEDESLDSGRTQLDMQSPVVDVKATQRDMRPPPPPDALAEIAPESVAPSVRTPPPERMSSSMPPPGDVPAVVTSRVVITGKPPAGEDLKDTVHAPGAAPLPRELRDTDESLEELDVEDEAAPPAEARRTDPGSDPPRYSEEPSTDISIEEDAPVDGDDGDDDELASEPTVVREPRSDLPEEPTLVKKQREAEAKAPPSGEARIATRSEPPKPASVPPARPASIPPPKPASVPPPRSSHPPPPIAEEEPEEAEQEPEVAEPVVESDRAPAPAPDEDEPIEPEEDVAAAPEPASTVIAPPPPAVAVKAKAAPPAPPPVATKPKAAPPASPEAGSPYRDSAPREAKRKAWWETFFNDDYLRTVRPPRPAQVMRQCNYIEYVLGLQPGATILDVGCGLGLQCVELSTRGYLVVGVDLSLPMLSRAADEAQDAGQKINFLHADMRELSFDGTFDAVMSLGTSFGYFDEETNKAVLERMKKALKPGGVLLLDMVNRDFVLQQQPNLVWFEGDGCVCMEETQFNYITSRLHVKRTVILDDGRQRENEYAIRLYTLHELGQILHHMGFRVMEVSGREATPGVYFGAFSPKLIILAEKRADVPMTVSGTHRTSSGSQPDFPKVETSGSFPKPDVPKTPPPPPTKDE